jgi:threonine dehydrogenase-like Zn-dependent dehydrogenase
MEQLFRFVSHNSHFDLNAQGNTAENGPQMHALVFEAARRIVWREWPRPSQLEPGWALVRTRAVGICGSDIHGYLGEGGRRLPPLIMGHEAVGTVVALGKTAKQLQVGNRVCLQPVFACGDCDRCLAGLPQCCVRREFFGGTRHGAMCEFFPAPARCLIPAPGTLDDSEVTLAEPAAVAWRAAQRAGELTGRNVLVCGSGTIGLLTQICARHFGARRVVATDIDLLNRKAALALGADEAVDAASDDAEARVRGRFDVAFDAVGITPSFTQALRAAKPGGAVVAIAGWSSVDMPLSLVVTKELRLVGTYNYTPGEFASALDWLARRPFDFSRFLTHRFPLRGGARAFADIASREIKPIKAILVAD